MRYDCHVDVASVRAGRADEGRAPPHLVLVDTVGVGGQLHQLTRMLAGRGGHARAVAAVHARTPPADVQALHAHGVRAARLRVGSARGAPALLECEMLAARLPADWHIEVAGSLPCAARWAGVLSRIGRPVVVEIDPSGLGPTSPQQVAALAWWLAMGNLHLKLLLACSALASPCASMRPLRTLLEAFPDRFLWGRGPLDAPLEAALQARLDATARRVYRF